MVSNIAEWIKTLDKVKQLGAQIVCPGHGPIGGPEIIIDQQRYWVELQRRIRTLVDDRHSWREINTLLKDIAAELRQMPEISRYVPDSPLLDQQANKLFKELGGAESSN